MAKNGTLIAGATNNVYNISSTIISQDGNKYYCVVTDSNNTIVESDDSLLNVNQTILYGPNLVTDNPGFELGNTSSWGKYANSGIPADEPAVFNVSTNDPASGTYCGYVENSVRWSGIRCQGIIIEVGVTYRAKYKLKVISGTVDVTYNNGRFDTPNKSYNANSIWVADEFEFVAKSSGYESVDFLQSSSAAAKFYIDDMEISQKL